MLSSLGRGSGCPSPGIDPRSPRPGWSRHQVVNHSRSSWPPIIGEMEKDLVQAGTAQIPSWIRTRCPCWARRGIIDAREAFTFVGKALVKRNTLRSASGPRGKGSAQVTEDSGPRPSGPRHQAMVMAASAESTSRLLLGSSTLGLWNSSQHRRPRWDSAWSTSLGATKRIRSINESRPAAEPPSKPRAIAFKGLGLEGPGRVACSAMRRVGLHVFGKISSLIWRRTFRELGLSRLPSEFW
jgi:hypothetical protein